MKDEEIIEKVRLKGFDRKELKKSNKINNTPAEINKWSFDTKLQILRKNGFLSQPQFSKMMSLKWDRNIFGHPSKSLETKQAMDDADAMIKIGINAIRLVERKIVSIKKLKLSRF